MSPDSLTEREFTRSIHFAEAESKENALKQTAFYQEQIAFYLANVFADRSTYTFDCTQTLETDRVFTIRKGSAILSVKTVFGINTSYRELPVRKFYTFTITATHRNEILDNTGKVNEVIEWAFRIIGGLIIGGVFAVILFLFNAHIGAHLIGIVFAFGSAVGGVIGQLISNKIYSTMETRLEVLGEVTAVEEEWAKLKETIEIVFNESAENLTSV